MPKGWRGWGLWAAAQVALTFFLKLIYKLAEDAVLGWGDDQIATALGITSPTLKTVVEWGLPFCSAIVILAIYHFTHSRWGQTPAKAIPEIESPPPGPIVSAWDSAVAELRNRYIEHPVEIDDDTGFLDYSADGFQALQDITKLTNASTEETEQLTAFIAKVTSSGIATDDLVRRRDDVAELAAFMIGYSAKMEDMAILVRAITSSVRDNQIKIVEHSTVTSTEDFEAMRGYMQAMQLNADASGRTAKITSEFRETMDRLKGISSALNKAGAKLSAVLGVLSKEFETYSSMTATLAARCSQKLAAAEESYGPKK